MPGMLIWFVATRLVMLFDMGPWQTMLAISPNNNELHVLEVQDGNLTETVSLTANNLPTVLFDLQRMTVFCFL